MKRSFALLLASLMLVFTLTACGRKDTQSNMQESTTPQNDSAVVGDDGTGDSTINPDSGSIQQPIENGMNDIGDGIDNAIDDITGTNGSDNGGMTYDQMLNNGQVDHGTLAEDGTAAR